jgi:hypothetical protein
MAGAPARAAQKLMADFRNVSTVDRVLRLAIGAGMLAASWSGVLSGLPGIACGIFGWAPVVTGAIAWSPVYALLQISSRRRPRPHREG